MTRRARSPLHLHCDNGVQITIHIVQSLVI